MTNRVELYDAITHLKHLQKRPKGLGSMIRRADQQGGSEAQVQMGTGSASLEEGILVVEPGRFRRASGKTTPRQYLSCALDIRSFQRLTRLNRCDINLVKKELTETKVPISQSGSGVSEKTIRKAALEHGNLTEREIGILLYFVLFYLFEIVGWIFGKPTHLYLYLFLLHLYVLPQ